MTSTGEDNQLIIVSNRLPLTFSKDKSGHLQVAEGAGGLVTAMVPVLKLRGGLWIGWPGTNKESRNELKNALNESTVDSNYSFEPVMLTDEEVENYYYGFANEVLWPLFHDLQTRCNFDPAYWKAYRQVNRKFARIIAENSRENDTIWVHDYHLMTVGKELRKMDIRSKIGFFLHIPFPAPDLYFKLPWRNQLIDCLLDYDLIGFQTLQDRQNFIQCIRAIYKDIIVRGRGKVITVITSDREIRIGTFPISIDYKEFVQSAQLKSVTQRAEEIHRRMNVRHIVLGIDRLDYTKGIPERLAAFELALKKYPQLQGNMSLLQLVVPSRTHIPKYSELKEELELKVSQINGQYGFPGWTPVHYMFRSIDRQELLAFYRAADIAFITPLRDGMNLVAKEYAAANVEENGVLILSEFTGAKTQLKRGAILVNPYDVDAAATALMTATQLDTAKRKKRMRRLRKNVRKNDIYRWLDSFLAAVFSEN